ncbi:MAG: ferrous iron transport protein A [Gammaproteobacteria bacterium]|nr:ferrous iron transport protein A [Gammaproteobacteria bacterium]
MLRTLAMLAPGQTGVVSGYAQIDEFAHRLMQLGFLEGTSLVVLRRAPAGDPMEVEIMGYSVSLRRDEAAAILIAESPATAA